MQKVNRKPDKINELMLKTKADLKERPEVILGLFFLLIDWLSYEEWAEFVEIERPR